MGSGSRVRPEPMELVQEVLDEAPKVILKQKPEILRKPRNSKSLPRPGTGGVLIMRPEHQRRSAE